MFRKIVGDLSKAVEQHVRVVTNRALQKHQQQLDTQSSIEMIDVPKNLSGGRLDYPKQVAQV